MQGGSRRTILGAALGLVAGAGAARALPGAGLVEPQLRLAVPAPAPGVAPVVALTLDACDGGVDHRILDLLLARSVPATVFVSGKWLRRNPETFAALLARPGLFEIGDHGLRHLAAVDRPMRLYGVAAAGSATAVAAEVAGGAAALIAAGAPPPRWFRGATALYSPATLSQIGALGYRVAGFSLNADEGASLGAAGVRRRIGRAVNGDVLIAHLNQPHRPAGQGVALGIADLLERGYRFVRLSDYGGLATPPA